MPGSWLYQVGKLIAQNNIMTAKNPASSDLDFLPHASLKTCCSEAVKSEYTLKTGLKRSESVLFEILCTPAMFLPRLTGYDSVGQEQACTVISDAVGVSPVFHLHLLKGSGLLYQVQCEFCQPSVDVMKSLQHLKWLQTESHLLRSVAAENHHLCQNSEKQAASATGSVGRPHYFSPFAGQEVRRHLTFSSLLVKI